MEEEAVGPAAVSPASQVLAVQAAHRGAPCPATNQVGFAKR